MEADRTIALGVNDGIQISRVFAGDEEDHRLHTYVGDVRDDRMVLPIPSSSGVLMYFPVASHLAVYVTREDALYRGESRVLRVFRRRRIPVMEARVPGSYIRVQRRENVRWECSLDVRWQAVDGAECEGRGITVNISCAGMLCGSGATPRIGRTYLFEMALPNEPLWVEGVVVRTESEDRASGTLWAVDFTRIQVNDQDRIVSYIFGEQLRMRRLGLL